MLLEMVMSIKEFKAVIRCECKLNGEVDGADLPHRPSLSFEDLKSIGPCAGIMCAPFQPVSVMRSFHYVTA